MLDLAAEKKVIEKSGAWYAYEGERLGQGRENAKQFLKSNPALLKKVEDQLREMLGLRKPAATVDEKVNGQPAEKERGAEKEKVSERK